MNLHHLADVLRGDVTPNHLLNEINSEVREYRAAFSKRGSSRSILVTEDNLQVLAGREEVKKLCSWLLRVFLTNGNCNISLTQST
jgi:hypothetical protein